MPCSTLLLSLPSTNQSLRDAAEEVDFETLTDALAVLAAQLDAGRHRFLLLVQRVDEHGGWADGGFRSTAHYLSWKTNLALGAAREHVRVARALPELPRISEAFGQGQLSYSKVRALTRVATADNEEDLLVMARDATTSQLERIVRATRRVFRHSQANEVSTFERRFFNLRREADGALTIEGRLPPDLGAELEVALESVMARDAEPTPAARDVSAENSGAPSPSKRSVGQRRADALVSLARSALDHQLEQGTNADRMQIVLRDGGSSSNPLEDVTLADGTRLSPETSRRLCCDISVVTPDLRKRRKPTSGQRRALAERHLGCAFPGCTHDRFLQAHHLEHWAHGGETSLDNLVLLCSFHHRLVHEGGFGLRRDHDQGLVFFDRRGERLSSKPPEARPIDTEGAIETLGEALRAEGVLINPQTAMHGGGGSFDLGWAVELVLAAGASS